MNQNSALRFEDLTENAAVIADTSLIVRARFVEAADTMLHVGVRGLWPADLKAFWPEHILDYKEVKLRYRPDARAISRAEEVLYGWMLEYVREDERRYLLGRWAMCLAAPHVAGSWRSFCQKENRIRRTADRWVQSEYESISSALIKNAKSLHEPNWSRVSPMMPNSSSELDKVRTPAAKHDLHMLLPGAKPFHDPDSPELAALIKRLEKANRRRRGKRAA
ncbi:hypothetical protein [Rhizobium sp. BK251]|uniref:hypothetical protein n=1 Tax=Rhizobium sp. BK251 TaxID=2512125 RepID=UPI00104C85F9|nr:hypothetical protein [Rhizobium sp. BK251]TCL70630.1 hypothetical protein EV286_107507 [Rhizobium sp. BK251]